MTERTRLDFDAFRKEASGEPKELVVGGITYLLPPRLPAATALDVIRLQADTTPCEKHAGHGAQPRCKDCQKGQPELLPQQLFDMADPLFGPGLLRKIAVEHGLDVDELGELIMATFNMYNSEVPRPNRAARRSRAKRTAQATSG